MREWPLALGIVLLRRVTEMEQQLEGNCTQSGGCLWENFVLIYLFLFD